MVEITYQMVLSTLQTIALIVGIAYYLFIMRNSQRNQELTRKSQDQALDTRQAQLFMTLFESFRSLEFRRLWHQVLVYDWKDFDDWEERFNERTNPEAIAAYTSVMLFFDGIGVLLKEDLIDIKLVYELMAPSIIVTWARYEPIIMGDREYFQTPEFWGSFEYLYNKIMKIKGDPEGLKQSRGTKFFQVRSEERT